jgi:uncharacterized membrane protein YfcA
MKFRINAKKIQLNNGQKKTCACVSGAVAGIVNGLFGGGGGMIIVPALILLLGVFPKKAHATAILVILPLSLVSTLFYSALKSIDLTVSIPVGIGVTVGGVFGALLLSKISSKVLIVIFSVIMAFAGVKMLFF